MNTVRSHLRGMHEASAQHHLELAKCHDKISKCFGKMAKSDGDNADAFGELAEHHQAMMDAHASAAENAVACCKSLDATGKTVGVADSFDANDIVPDHVSGILRKFPTAVPRAGAPNPASVVDTTGMDPRLADLVKVEHAE